MKIKKIMLIQPSSITPTNTVRRLITPLALLYLGAILRDNGYEVQILDSPCEGYDNVQHGRDFVIYGLSDKDIIKRVKEYSPDLVGVTSPYSYQKGNSLHYCDLVKEFSKDIPTVIGGVHPSLAPEDTIKHKSVDYVIMGEGEYRFLKLLDLLNSGKKTFDFDGVAYMDNGVPVINACKDRIDKLDNIPLPARDLINMERYIEVGMTVGPFPKRRRVEQILTSRGCPLRCHFCSSVKYWGYKIKMRSVDNIMEEIDYLVGEYGIEEVQFIDDNFTFDRKRIIELLKRLKNYNLSWCTPNGVMVHSLDADIIKMMADSGAYQLTFAIESGNSRVLKDIIKKSVPPKHEVKKLVEACHANNITVHGFFVVGFPGETREEMYQTFQYPFDNEFDSLSFFIAHPSYGSGLYNECKKKGYLIEENIRGDVKHVEMNIPPSSPDFVMPKEELEELVATKVREFNEVVKAKDPEAWKLKYGRFLEEHGDQASLLDRTT